PLYFGISLSAQKIKKIGTINIDNEKKFNLIPLKLNDFTVQIENYKFDFNSLINAFATRPSDQWIENFIEKWVNENIQRIDHDKIAIFSFYLIIKRISKLTNNVKIDIFSSIVFNTHFTSSKSYIVLRYKSFS
ncbi:hypothetical protein MHK_010025, partial [Candidatus Magnetomorum sp. HK-1]